MKLETGNVQNYISEKIPSMDDLKKNGENVQSYLTEKIPTMDELKRNGEDVQNYIKDKVPTMADLKRKGSEISEKIPTMDDLKGKSGEVQTYFKESVKSIPSIDDFWDLIEHLKKNFADGIVSGVYKTVQDIIKWILTWPVLEKVVPTLQMYLPERFQGMLPTSDNVQDSDEKDSAEKKVD